MVKFNGKLSDSNLNAYLGQGCLLLPILPPGDDLDMDNVDQDDEDRDDVDQGGEDSDDDDQDDEDIDNEDQDDVDQDDPFQPGRHIFEHHHPPVFLVN